MMENKKTLWFAFVSRVKGISQDFIFKALAFGSHIADLS
jgi:hypothetical protein